MWQHLRKNIAADGTHVRTYLKGILLLASTKDGNNQLVNLALSYTICEDGDNWLWFLQLLNEDLPGIRVRLRFSAETFANNFYLI